MARRAPGLQALGVLLLGITGGGCASYSDLRFEPALQETELRGEANDLQARIVVAWRGIEEREGVPVLNFRVRVENPGPTLFMLVPNEFELLDAGLNSFGLADTGTLPLSVGAGGSTTLDLAFPVPGGSLEGFDLSVLTLRTRFQGDRWSWNTTFQRVVQYDPGPHWGFSLGWVVGS